ncbi:hypothetical protein F0L46_21430 [Salinarimonas soli]|uniref:TnsA endonuclease N-terminal domain-containing protein n=1 Tax=Salinarimonas soli TaxID=1638099 RepID=A0A5B2V7G6_9HYPH|nr:hypothetical protein F0L46_21430 [Salinarimonas soli]
MRETPPYNYGSAIDGVGADHKALGRAPFRSLLERDMRTLLGANPAIDCYAVEPHTLHYFMPNGRGGFDQHEYVPDVVCRYRAGPVVVVDAKALYLSSRPSWQAREPHIREAYELDHRVAFVVLDETDIRVEPRLSNCQILERHRYIVRDDEALARVRDALLAVGFPTTVREVVHEAGLKSVPGTCRAFTALLNLALGGEVFLDLGAPFAPDTTVWRGL